MPLNFISKYKIRKLHKNHPKKVCAFLGIKELTDDTISSLNIDIVSQLLSLSNLDWENWEQLLLSAKALQNKYRGVVRTYIKENFGKTTLEDLSLNELKLLNMETNAYWQKLILDKKNVEEIMNSYPEGFALYKKIHTDSNSKNIIKDLNEIIALQERFDYSQVSKKALEKCTSFSKEVIDILNSKTFKTNIKTLLFNTHIYDEYGKKENRKVSYKQSFIRSYSPYRVEEQNSNMQNNYSIYQRLIQHKERWVDELYTQYAELLLELDEKYHNQICFIFITSNSKNITNDIYQHHYIRLLAKLKRSMNIFYYNDDRWRDKQYKYFIVIDIFTIHEDMQSNIKSIMQSHDILPAIIYLSFIREMPESEVDKMIEQQ